MIKNFPRFLNEIENRLVPIGFEQYRLTADLHGMAPRKRYQQPSGGFNSQNPYCELRLCGDEREIQMGLDEHIAI